HSDASDLLPFPTRRSSDLPIFSELRMRARPRGPLAHLSHEAENRGSVQDSHFQAVRVAEPYSGNSGLLAIVIVRYGVVQHQQVRSEEHTSELQSRGHLVCR